MKYKFLNKSNFKIWSKLGMRASFGLAALEVIKEIDNLMILTSDVSTSAGLDRFRKQYPENYIDVGIAEQNLLGVAAGLSSEGFNTVTTTFSPFQTLRCCEQIKVNLGYMKHKVVMVGLASGLVLGNLGYTHCSIEDIGVLRSIPNLKIICPADPAEAIKSFVSSLFESKSVYIRLTGGSNMSQIYEDDYEFGIGKSITLKKGDDITIFANGTMVKTALDVSILLDKDQISTEVVNMHTVKPIDKNKIEEVAKKKKLVISLEEHNIIGGLGSSVAEVLSGIEKSPKHILVGINDEYSEGGDYKYLINKFKLDKESISKRIIEELKS